MPIMGRSISTPTTTKSLTTRFAKLAQKENNIYIKRNPPAGKAGRHEFRPNIYQKTEKYFKKTNRIMLGDRIVTKVIRMTADNLNQKEQIVLNKSALLSCELDDLLK